MCGLELLFLVSGKMKKIFKVFTKPKKRTDNFQNIHEDYANDTSKTFGYFQFDANISKIDKKTFSETPETYNTRETEQYAKDLDHIRASLTLSETVCCNNTSLVTNTSQTTAQDKYKCSRTQRKVTDKKFHTTSGYNDTIPESKIEKSQQENKMKTSVHIININNCKYFHIGPKTTIDVRTSGKEIHKLLGADELCSPDDLENLLDNEEVSGLKKCKHECKSKFHYIIAGLKHEKNFKKFFFKLVRRK
ncbi:hypothetical protein RUM43_000786 [Polyplax serrata]|uniref:Uncharacterized protein n=1 Tax=Polyplax serrata TaxID=468196 RepID=A0AAN8SDV8_POLSC